MTQSDYHTRPLQLCVVPRSRVVHATAIMGKPVTYFDACTGNTFFVPVHSIPHAEVDGWKIVEGTQIHSYTPELEVLWWQFGRNWMGHPEENYTLLAASEEEVFSVLRGDLYLVTTSDELLTRLPSDCNIHWRGFSQNEQQTFQRLLQFLQGTTVVITSDDVPEHTQLLLAPLPTIPGEAPMQWGRGDSLLKIDLQSDGNLMVRLATVFSPLYGFDLEDD